MRFLSKAVPGLSLILLLGAGSPAQGNGSAGALPEARPATIADCPDAGITEIQLSHVTAVDQILVEVTEGTDRDGDGVSRIEVSDGRFGRAVTVFGPGQSGLSFEPALRGQSFRVELDPVFTAGTGVCVSRVALLSDGREIASVRP